MLFTVYDPKGEKFEVAAYIAKELIITHGWDISLKEKPSQDEEEPIVNTASK